MKLHFLFVVSLVQEEKWGNLNKKIKTNLIKNIQQVMSNSYISGGAELKDFKNPFNSSKFKLKIYGKKYTENKNLVISKNTSDSRKTWFCSKQQKLL